MKRYVILAVVALIFTLSPGIASAGNRKACNELLQVSFDSDTRGDFGFRITRKFAWEEVAERRYGARYAEWDLATTKTTSCQNMWKGRVFVTGAGSRSTAPKPKKFKCVVKAKPCIVQTSNKTCYGKVYSGFFRFGKGTGNKKKKAKQLARTNWQQKVTGLYGAAFSEWKMAKKRRVNCRRDSKKCMASARPCKFN